MALGVKRLRFVQYPCYTQYKRSIFALRTTSSRQDKSTLFIGDRQLAKQVPITNIILRCREARLSRPMHSIRSQLQLWKMSNERSREI